MLRAWKNSQSLSGASSFGSAASTLGSSPPLLSPRHAQHTSKQRSRRHHSHSSRSSSSSRNNNNNNNNNSITRAATGGGGRGVGGGGVGRGADGEYAAVMQQLRRAKAVPTELSNLSSDDPLTPRGRASSKNKHKYQDEDGHVSTSSSHPRSVESLFAKYAGLHRDSDSHQFHPPSTRHHRSSHRSSHRSGTGASRLASDKHRDLSQMDGFRDRLLQVDIDVPFSSGNHLESTKERIRNTHEVSSNAGCVRVARARMCAGCAGCVNGCTLSVFVHESRESET